MIDTYFKYALLEGLLLYLIADHIECSPRGVVVFAKGGSHNVITTSTQKENESIFKELPLTAKIIVGFLFGFLGILILIGLYKIYQACHECSEEQRKPANGNNQYI